MRVAEALAWAVVGALALYLVMPNDPVSYPEVIVPAARILEREVPGEVRWRDRIVYRYLLPDVVATAPGGATEDVATFCRPVTVADTVVVERRELVRSVVTSPSLLPLRRDGLLVTSVVNTGDIIARDYHVRPGWGLRAADSVLVRYPRWSVAREVGEGVAWWAAISGVVWVLSHF